MFSIYGATGQLFRGTLEQMRQIPQVRGADRARAIEPVVRDGSDSALREAVEYGAPTSGAAVHRSAIAAYETTRQPPAHGWYDLAVGDIMSRPVMTLPLDTSVYDAWRELARQGRAQAPVVNAGGTLVGMVTRSVMADFDPWPEPGALAQAWESWRARTVEAVMVTPVPSVAPSADLRRAAGALLDSGLPGLPVVDDAGGVIGFVSRSDLLRAALKDAGLDVWG